MKLLQSNLISSNTDGSFTMADSNSFLSPYAIHPIAQENLTFRNISSWNFMCVLIRIASILIEVILMNILNQVVYKKSFMPLG